MVSQEVLPQYEEFWQVKENIHQMGHCPILDEFYPAGTGARIQFCVLCVKASGPKGGPDGGQ